MSLPNDAQLIAFALGELPDSETRIVAEYLAATPEARARVARMQTAVATMRGDDSVPVPAAARERAVALWQPAAEPAGWLADLRRAVASLLYDGGATPALAGFRGPSGSLQLTYSSELGEIELEAEPDESGAFWHLTGQLSADAPAAGRAIALVRAGTQELHAQASADERGMFSLSCVPGAYDLLIRGPESVVVLPGIRIG